MTNGYCFSKLFSCGRFSSLTTAPNTPIAGRASAIRGEATRSPSYELVFVQHEADSYRPSDRDSTRASKYGHRGQKSCLAVVKNLNELWMLSPVCAALHGTRSAVELKEREANDEA